jgi:hypothetical protein
MKKERTSRLVRSLDTEAARPLLAAVYEALYGEPLAESVTVDEQVLVVGWNDSAKMVDVATVCTEGVGEWLTDGNCIEVWVSGGFRQFTIPLGLNRIPVREEPVDLAGHVRSFGARLESNWYLWHRAAEVAAAKGIPSHLAPFTADAG